MPTAGASLHWEIVGQCAHAPLGQDPRACEGCQGVAIVDSVLGVARKCQWLSHGVACELLDCRSPTAVPVVAVVATGCADLLPNDAVGVGQAHNRMRTGGGPQSPPCKQSLKHEGAEMGLNVSVHLS